MKKNIWKKLSGILLVFVMVMAMLTGCAGSSESDSSADSSASYLTEESVISDTDSSAEGSSESDSIEASDSTSGSEDSQDIASEGSSSESEDAIDEDGEYTSKDDVALYLYTYGHLPSNFITKKEAKSLGWVSSEGNLGEVAPGKSIGGDYFGNYEEVLPVVSGREYHECDINSDGGYRGAERIIYSNEGQIYYTNDHYKTFTLLYGEE